jgi:hypothetical protein
MIYYTIKKCGTIEGRKKKEIKKEKKNVPYLENKK